MTEGNMICSIFGHSLTPNEETGFCQTVEKSQSQLPGKRAKRSVLIQVLLDRVSPAGILWARTGTWSPTSFSRSPASSSLPVYTCAHAAHGQSLTGLLFTLCHGVKHMRCFPRAMKAPFDLGAHAYYK